MQKEEALSSPYRSYRIISEQKSRNLESVHSQTGYGQHAFRTYEAPHLNYLDYNLDTINSTSDEHTFFEPNLLHSKTKMLEEAKERREQAILSLQNYQDAPRVPYMNKSSSTSFVHTRLPSNFQL